MSKQKKAPEVTGDEDTDAILSEMEQAGEEIPAFGDLPEDDDSKDDADNGDEDDDADDSNDDADEDDDSDDAEEDDEDADDSDADTDDQDEDDESEGDEDDADDDQDAEESEDKNVPLWKRHKELKKQLKDAQALISSNEKSKKETTDADFDKQLDAFAAKHKTSKEAARDLLDLAASIAESKAGLPADLKGALESVVKRDKHQQFWKEQEKSYVKDFTSNVAPLAARDGKNPAKVQKRLQELAFKPENAKKSLVELYLTQYGKEEGTKAKRRITSEGNRTHGRVSGKAAEDFQPEDIDDMSDEEFDEFSESLGKASKSRIVRH